MLLSQRNQLNIRGSRLRAQSLAAYLTWKELFDFFKILTCARCTCEVIPNLMSKVYCQRQRNGSKKATTPFLGYSDGCRSNRGSRLQAQSLAAYLTGKECFNFFKISTCARCICCLLYTSPSPRDRQKSRMPSSA